MNQSIFETGYVRVIGFRGAVPYKIGLFPPVYYYQFEDKEYYAIGEEFDEQRRWPCRTSKRIYGLMKRGGIARLVDRMRVDDGVVVLCVTDEADATLSTAVPDWRATHVPSRVYREMQRHEEPTARGEQKVRSTLRYPHVEDPPALAFLLLPEEAEELALTTAIAIHTLMDDCLLDTPSDRSVLLAEELGWIAWGLLSVKHHRARRDTMTRLIAARFLQPHRSDLLRLAHHAATSLGEPNAETVIDLARAYLRTGVKPAPKNA